MHTTPLPAQPLKDRGFAGNRAAEKRGFRTLKVLDSPTSRRICASHGLSHVERDLLSEGFDYMRGRWSGLFVSIEAGRATDAEKIVREVTRRIRSNLAQHQRRARMRRTINVSVFEALGRDGFPKFGAHIVAVLPNASARDRVIESVNRSKAYRRFDERITVLAEPVTDWSRLMTYLLKEATPQARFRLPFRRIGGSIPLGELGGNRVILSRDLRDILVRSGRIAPYMRSYAKRRLKHEIQPPDGVASIPEDIELVRVA